LLYLNEFENKITETNQFDKTGKNTPPIESNLQKNWPSSNDIFILFSNNDDNNNAFIGKIIVLFLYFYFIYFNNLINYK